MQVNRLIERRDNSMIKEKKELTSKKLGVALSFYSSRQYLASEFLPTSSMFAKCAFYLEFNVP